MTDRARISDDQLREIDARARAAMPTLQWSETRLAMLLRYGRKNLGPWDGLEYHDDQGDLPPEAAAAHIVRMDPVTTLALVATLRDERSATKAWMDAARERQTERDAANARAEAAEARAARYAQALHDLLDDCYERSRWLDSTAAETRAEAALTLTPEAALAERRALEEVAEAARVVDAEASGAAWGRLAGALATLDAARARKP